MALFLLKENVFSETKKNVSFKMDLMTDCHKVGRQTVHSRSSIRQILFQLLKDLVNLSLKVSNTGEICSNKLSRTENKLSETSTCV